MRMKMKQFLGILLSITLILGLMPGMGLTAYAAPTETLLTTITGAGANAGPATSANVSYSTEGVATLTFSEPTSDGQVVYQASPACWGWWGYAITLTVTPAEGYTITKCVFYDDANRTATDSEAPFIVETTKEDKTPKVNGTPISANQSKGIKKIEVYGYVATPAHTHDFTSYTASGDTITATCVATGCDLPPSTAGGTDHAATLTIATPTSLSYDGTAKAAVITDANSIQGDAKVQYQKKTGDSSYDTATETAPTDPGTYKAGITLGEATASVEYTITVTPLNITGATLTSRDYVANNKSVTVTGVTFDGGTPTFGTDYTATAEMADDTAGDSKAVTVTVTLSNTHYSLATNTYDTTVKINKAKPAKPAVPTAAGRTDTSVTLTATQGYQYKRDGGEGWQDSNVFTGLTEDKSYNFYQRVKSTDDNHDNSDSSDAAVIRTKQEPISYAVINENGGITVYTVDEYIKAQTSSNTVWLNNGDIYVVKSDATLNKGLVYTGNVTLILCDGAKLTVKGGIWHYGSELTIYGQNGQSGEIVVQGDKDITLNNVPSWGDASSVSKDSAIDGGTINVNGGKISVTPGPEQNVCGSNATVVLSANVSLTGTKSGGEKETLTNGSFGASQLNQFTTFAVKPVAVVKTEPKANTLTYSGQAQELVTAGEAEGGTMKYALGTDATTAPAEADYKDAIPTDTNVGTYYVWYKVVGDGNHNDTDPVCVTVKIAQYIPPHYHSYTSTVTKEPTCTEAGERTYRCSCGSSYKETIKATGHTLVAHEAKDAICGEDGNKAYWECSLCKKLFSDAEAKTETTLDAVTVKATGEHTLTAHKAKDVTCTEDGSKAYWECSVCKKLFADAEAKTEMTLEETVIKAEGHKLTSHEAKEATCTEDGNKAYWECSVCKKLFADAQAKTETTLEAVTEKAKGHTFTAHEAKEVTCTEDGSKAYWECSVCKKLYSDAEGKTETALEETVIKTEGHKLTAHEAKEVTCTEDGKKAYWECSVCKKLFADAEGKTETTEDALVIKSEGHKLTHVEAKEPTEEEDGNIEYWVCSECGKFFSDEEGKNEISEEDTKISKYIDITKATVTGLAVKAYTGKAITPVITVKYDGKTLKKGTDYTVDYANNTNVGAATVTITGKGDYAGTITKKFLIKQISFKYRAYVQKKNWMSWSTAKVSGTEASKMAGTTDNLRMETIQMQLSGVGGSVEYRAYCAKKGWTQWATTADTTTYAGTKGEARRVEMIQLRAKGQVANLYDMYFRTYCEKLGWLNWAKSGEKAGTQGYAYKLEAFQVNFVRKGETFKLADQNKMAKSFYDKTKDGANPQ